MCAGEMAQSEDVTVDLQCVHKKSGVMVHASLPALGSLRQADPFPGACL